MGQVTALAGQLPGPSLLVDVPRLVTAYFTDAPDPAVPAQRVSFGTSGHRGSSLDRSFNEDHILAITEAIARYRHAQQIDGPLFLGVDTHALSAPAAATALEVLAAHGVRVELAEEGAYTPTPVISHAIVAHNRRRVTGLADGIVITPSHNPPADGGIKYNPPSGGPAQSEATAWIAAEANALLVDGLRGVKRIPYQRALRAETTHRHDFRTAYVDDLASVIDMRLLRTTKIRMGADPLGGASVQYWGAIAERYGLDLTSVNEVVDPTFRFVPLDWDGQIRMDPSSAHVMQGLVALRDRFDIAFACDTDADRHGIVTPSGGLLAPNQFLCAATAYLFAHRPRWGAGAGIGKTVVTSQLMDRVAHKLGRKLYEVPVGFKWFVDGLAKGSLGVAGEESAGATCLRMDGGVWTTDKDGLVPSLLAAEMTARTGRDPAALYRELTAELGEPVYGRIEAPATREQQARLQRLSPADFTATELAGERITGRHTRAPGNDAPTGGLKVTTASGWCAARPSGTEAIYKIYAESFLGPDHLQRILEEAQVLVDGILVGAASLPRAEPLAAGAQPSPDAPLPSEA